MLPVRWVSWRVLPVDFVQRKIWSWAAWTRASDAGRAGRDEGQGGAVGRPDGGFAGAVLTRDGGGGIEDFVLCRSSDFSKVNRRRSRAGGSRRPYRRRDERATPGWGTATRS